MDFIKSLVERPVKEILKDEFFLTENEFKEYVNSLEFMGKELEEHLEYLRFVREDLGSYLKNVEGS